MLITTDVMFVANKSANISARVEPEIKQQAEAILAKLGLPVSVVIDTLYRQIIMTGGLPYSISIPQLPTLDSMSKQKFDAMMAQGYDEAVNDKGIDAKAVFSQLREELR